MQNRAWKMEKKIINRTITCTEKNCIHIHPQALMTIGYYICLCVCFFGLGSFPYGIAYCIFRSTADSYGFISEIASDAWMSNQINIYFYSFEKIVFNQTENLIKFFSVVHSPCVVFVCFFLPRVISVVIFIYRIWSWLNIYWFHHFFCVFVLVFWGQNDAPLCPFYWFYFREYSRHGFNCNDH